MNLRPLIITLSLLPLIACTPPHTVKRTQRLHKEAHTIYALRDGRYAYQDNGFWYYYVMSQALSSSRSAAPPPIITSSGGSVGLPSGSWTKGTAPDKADVEEGRELGEEVVVEDENSEPVDEVEAEAAEAAPTTASEASSTSSETSSSSSDAGGGSSDGGGGSSE